MFSVCVCVCVHRVLEVAEGGSERNWEVESSGSEVEMEDQQLTEEQREHKKQFREWRKKHYNEFFAVKRARELLEKVSLSDLLRTEDLGVWNSLNFIRYSVWQFYSC